MEVKIESLNGLEGSQWLSNNQLHMEDPALEKNFEGFLFPASYQSLTAEANSVGVVPSLTTLYSEDAREMYKNVYKHPIAGPHDELQQPQYKVLKLGNPGLLAADDGSLSMHPRIRMHQRHLLHEQHYSHQQLLQRHRHQVPQQHLHQGEQAYQPASYQLKEASIYKGQCGHNNAPLQAPIMRFDSRSYGANFRQGSCISFGISNDAATREMPLSSCESVGDGHIADPSPFLTRGNCEGHAAAPSKTADQIKDHILAERRRREKLSERFIALSAVLPGLKKMDKATILADAVKFVKQLKEKLGSLEEQATKARSVPIVKLSSQRESPNVEMLVECQQRDIEIRIVGKSVLIRLHCEKFKGILVRAMAELENLHLMVVNASILSFSDKAFDLTFCAQIEDGYEVTTELITKGLEDVVRRNP